MPWSGGVFTRDYPSWTNDANSSLPISASKFDQEDNGLALGLNNCLTIDGLNKPTATLNWAVQMNWTRATDGNVWSLARTGGANNPKLQGSVTDATGVTLAVTGGALALTSSGAMNLTPTGNLTLNPTGNLTESPAGNLTLSPTGNLTLSPTGTLNLGTPTSFTIGPPGSGAALTVNGSGDGTSTIIAKDDTGGFAHNNTAGNRILTTSTVKGWTGAGVNVTDSAIGSRGLLNIYASNSITAATMQLSSTAITGLGPIAGAQIDMTPDASSFTGTLTGYASPPTGTVKWRRMGNFVSLYLEAGISGTSNSIAMTMTGMPAGLQPAATREVPCGRMTDAGNIDVAGTASVAASGTITFSILLDSPPNQYTGSFTASGTKGLSTGWCILYPL